MGLGEKIKKSMKMKLKLFLLIPFICLLSTCSKNDGDVGCENEKIFIPEDLLDWLPYYSNEDFDPDWKWGFYLE
jgi:hypothetical protein